MSAPKPGPGRHGAGRPHRSHPHSHRNDSATVACCAVVTVSDSRTPATDESGPLARRLLEEAGHRVVEYAIVPDDPDRLRKLVEALVGRHDVDAVVINGGTGIAPRDHTAAVLGEILGGRIEGFGELFRSLSFEEIGAAAMLSRAQAGFAGGTAVFSVPGSPAAVRLALERLIVPELGHVVSEIRKGAR